MLPDASVSGGECRSMASEGIVNCPYLEEIELQRNHLKALPSWMFTHLPVLRRLDASQNDIKSVDQSMWLCSSLVELNLSHNRLSALASSLQDGPIFSDGFTGDIEAPRPGSPGSITSDTVPPGSSSGARTPQNESEHPEVPVVRVERWRDRDRVKVKLVSYDDDESNGNRKRRSMLKDLDLSHNSFDNLPPVLACVAPGLERLCLAHNQLTAIGPVSAYPAGLLFLDLSFNEITTSEVTSFAGQEGEEACDILRELSLTRSFPAWNTQRSCQSPFHHRRFDSFFCTDA